MNGLQFRWAGLTRISRRERRTLFIGVTAVVLMLAGSVGMRATQAWSNYSETLNQKLQRVARLEADARARSQAAAQLASARTAMQPFRARLVRGATREVAAASLQQHVQAIASLANLQVGRVDVERSDSASESRLHPIRVVVNAQGDVYGLASFLAGIENAPVIMAIDEIIVTSGAQPFGARGRAPVRTEALNIELRLHGFYAQE